MVAHAPDRPRSLYILGEAAFQQLYAPDQQQRIAALTDPVAPPQTPASIAERPELLREVEILFSGWGGPVMDAAFLARAPKLRAVFYAAGSVRSLVTEAFWERNPVLSTAASVNAVPVAEYCLSQILFLLKQGYRFIQAYQSAPHVPTALRSIVRGAYRAQVGLVSYGLIARRTRALLRPFDVSVAVSCPFLTEAQAAAEGVTRMSLEALFASSDVVSLHTPNLPETRGMIRGEHFAQMRPNAAFLNSARGAVVHEPGMIAALQKRPDLTAVLDVTWPEPVPMDSPLRALPNLILTPHIAGSAGHECARMGEHAADECERYLRGEALATPVTRELAATMA